MAIVSQAAKFAVCAVAGAVSGALMAWKWGMMQRQHDDAHRGPPPDHGVLPRHAHVRTAPDGTWWSTEQDAARRHPRYTVELLTAASVQRRVIRALAPSSATTFRLHEDIPARWQASPSQYTRTGYDRGHMVPAADHRTSLDELAATFTMTNIAPQAPGLNRGYWARLESWLRHAAGQLPAGRAMTVITGPAYLPRWEEATTSGGKWRIEHDMLGPAPRFVGVPTHFFKVVAVHDNPLSVAGDATPPAPAPAAAVAAPIAVAAFLLPNAAVPAATPLTAFVVPLDGLEAVTGLDIAAALPPQLHRQAAETMQASWQPGTAASNLQRELGAPASEVAAFANHSQAAPATTIPATPLAPRVVHLCEAMACTLESAGLDTALHPHADRSGRGSGGAVGDGTTDS